MKPEIADTDLCAYLDGQLGPADAARVEAALASDLDLRARLDGFVRDRDLLREGMAGLPTGPADPQVLAQTDAMTRELARRLDARLADGGRRHPPAWLARAASVALLVGAGWVGHVVYAGASEDLPLHVAEAAGAHEVFAELRDRPVEIGADRRGEMVSWLSARLGTPITVPVLDSLGIDLVGGRLLGTKEGPLAHLVYEDGNGHRMTLSISPHAYVGNTDPVIVERGPVRLGYWSDDRLSYVLAARTTGAQLQAIAAEIAAPSRIEKAGLPVGR